MNRIPKRYNWVRDDAGISFKKKRAIFRIRRLISASSRQLQLSLALVPAMMSASSFDSLPSRCSPLSALPPSSRRSPPPASPIPSVGSRPSEPEAECPTDASVGGPWGDFVSRSDASMAKLLQDSLPKTRATRASWLASHQELSSDDRVDKVEFVDLYTGGVAVLLLPLAAVAYAAIGVAAVPGFAVAKLYVTCAMKRPTKSVERGRTFQILAILLWLLALPCHLLIACYWLVLFPTILVASAIYTIVSLKILLVRGNLALLQSCSRWPKWGWRDTVCALLGAMDRQGFAKFALKFPSAVVVAPMLKYLFGANPLLYRLTIRHRSLWTSPLDVDDQKAVAAVVQAASWTLVNLTELLPEQVSKPPRKDDRIVSGHLPFPAPDRMSGTVLGVLTTNSLVTLVNADHNVNGSVFHSATAKRSIYNLLLFVWNPCHYLTGYVEINLQHYGGIEQASTSSYQRCLRSEAGTHPISCVVVVWCVVGDNYLGNLLFERADALFWHYDPIKRGQAGPVSVRFIRGSVASTMSVTDSVLALDGSNNPNKGESGDFTDTGASYFYEAGVQDDYSHRRLSMGGSSSSFEASDHDGPLFSETGSTIDSVAMLQSGTTSVSPSDVSSSDRYVV
ncbi:hypothetical protein BBJ28_00009079 [Nothophytophthora sp. Chile5]|nr:hypothetical protein BBJ28_00009079 [Nothophytophthora sp. Chile5]